MLSKREYLIKCTKEEIKEINKNEDITKVLLIKNLNKISIIEKGNIIYILVNESYDILKENNNNINNEDESFELKDNGDFKYIKLSEEIIMDILQVKFIGLVMIQLNGIYYLNLVVKR